MFVPVGHAGLLNNGREGKEGDPGSAWHWNTEVRVIYILQKFEMSFLYNMYQQINK